MLSISKLFQQSQPLLGLGTRYLTVKHRPEKLVFGRVGKYVMAVYSAAVEKKELEKVQTDFKGMGKMLRNPLIHDFFKTNNIKTAEKAKMLMDAGKKAELCSCTLNLLGVLADNNRLMLLEKIIEVFDEVMRTYRNEVICEVITAKPLDDGTRGELTNTLKKLVKEKKIIMIEKVKPKLLGGLVLSIEDKHIDLSILRKVQMYRQLLTDPL